MTMQVAASGMPPLRVHVPLDIFEKALKRSDVSPMIEWIEDLSKRGRLPDAMSHLLKNKVDPRDITEVFEEHKKLFWNGKGREPQLLDGKKRLIRLRLEKFSKEELITALHVVAASPFWCGQNDRNKAFTGFKSIFKNNETVEDFLLEASEKGVGQDSRKVHEKREASALKLTEIAARMRSGESVGLDEKRMFSHLLSEHREKYGEKLDWTTGVFSRI